jgi:hypothetical protein
MKKSLLTLVTIFSLAVVFHIHRRSSADFFYINNKIELNTPWKFTEERYELLKDGFRVEQGNFLFYTEEVFEKGQYIYRFRIMGFPIKYRKVNYAHNYCWGVPGIPWGEWHKGWPLRGRKRFKKCLPKVEIYRKYCKRSRNTFEDKGGIK